jgi:pimeloyl-ACP methyl ester carboxylesterase
VPALPVILVCLVLGSITFALLAALLVIRHVEAEHDAKGHFIEVDGVRLHYRVTGDENKPAILVLHGAASNLEEPHQALNETFADEHVIWLDRPGLGWSERPNDGRWSPEREAQLIARFLDIREIGRVTVIGHSWGAAIAMRLAIDHSERVTGLVLIAPALSAWIGEAAWFNAVSFWPVLGPILTRLIVPLTGKQSLVSGAISAFHPEAVPEDYLRSTDLPLLLRTKNWLANAADMRDVNHHLESQERRYEGVEHATVFIAGKADTVVWTHRHSGIVSRRMKNAELWMIPGAGHNPHHHHQTTILRAVEQVRRPTAKLSKQVKLTG